jgi:hypothetical protein
VQSFQYKLKRYIKINFYISLFHFKAFCCVKQAHGEKKEGLCRAAKIKQAAD